MSMSFNPSEMFSILPVGYNMDAPPTFTANTLLKLVGQDHGLDQHKKQSLFSLIKSPEVFDHLVAGAAGVAMMHVVSKFTELPKHARTLLSLAGFGVGNIIYNSLHKRKFTEYDPATGMLHVKQ
jgi:hypothetical protein